MFCCLLNRACSGPTGFWAFCGVFCGLRRSVIRTPRCGRGNLSSTLNAYPKRCICAGPKTDGYQPCPGGERQLRLSHLALASLVVWSSGQDTTGRPAPIPCSWDTSLRFTPPPPAVLSCDSFHSAERTAFSATRDDCRSGNTDSVPVRTASFYSASPNVHGRRPCGWLQVQVLPVSPNLYTKFGQVSSSSKTLACQVRDGGANPPTCSIRRDGGGW